MSASAGRVLLIPKGEYNSQTTYQPLDMVYYNGNSYVCKLTSTGNLPTNTTYFQKMTEAPQAADMTGATSSAAGAHGLVPAPAAGDQDKVLKGDGTWGDVRGGPAYGESSTAAATAAKTATISGFKLVTGASVFIKFTNANTAANPTLNINDGNADTGAKAIKVGDVAFKDLMAGKITQLMYDGTCYQVVSDGVFLYTTITTSTSASVTATFTSSMITENSATFVWTDKDIDFTGMKLPPDSTQANTCEITFPPQASAQSVVVKLLVWG